MSMQTATMQSAATPMASADFVYNADKTVAWEQMWDSF